WRCFVGIRILDTFALLLLVGKAMEWEHFSILSRKDLRNFLLQREAKYGNPEASLHWDIRSTPISTIPLTVDFPSEPQELCTSEAPLQERTVDQQPLVESLQ
ncbi:MAG: hypothetical protein ABSC19_11545, partial [Syntrophorhabdales bacterium]